MIEWPVCQPYEQGRDVADESAPVCRRDIVVVNFVNRLDDQFGDSAVPGGDVAIVVVARPLSVENIFVAILGQLLITKTWFAVEVYVLPLHFCPRIKNVHISLQAPGISSWLAHFYTIGDNVHKKGALLMKVTYNGPFR
jgi:hypothetical protein